MNRVVGPLSALASGRPDKPVKVTGRTLTSVRSPIVVQCPLLQICAANLQRLLGRMPTIKWRPEAGPQDRTHRHSVRSPTRPSHHACEVR
jgi:hypothetical protein